MPEELEGARAVSPPAADAPPADADRHTPLPAHPFVKRSSIDPYLKAKGDGRVGSMTLMKLSSTPMAGFINEVRTGGGACNS